jgi:hypothetical protein
MRCNQKKNTNWWGAIDPIIGCSCCGSTGSTGMKSVVGVGITAVVEGGRHDAAIAASLPLPWLAQQSMLMIHVRMVVQVALKEGLQCIWTLAGEMPREIVVPFLTLTAKDRSNLPSNAITVGHNLDQSYPFWLQQS